MGCSEIRWPRKKTLSILPLSRYESQDLKQKKNKQKDEITQDCIPVLESFVCKGRGVEDARDASPSGTWRKATC